MPSTVEISSFDYIQSSELLNLLRSPRVLWADYDRICAGPLGKGRAGSDLAAVEKVAIDRWLESSAGVLSRGQSEANEVNEAVEVTGRSVVGYRPIRYGRAAIVETEGLLSGLWPLLDIKGCGVTDAAVPKVSYHGTGVVGMGRAFRELILAKTAEALLEGITGTVRPVGILAVLSLGFEIRQVGRVDTACVLVRAPHLRPRHNREVPDRWSPEMKVKIGLEGLFMNFGLSSAWKFMDVTHEGGEYHNRLDGGGVHPTLDASHMKLMLDHLSDGRSYAFGMANIQLCREIGIAPLMAELIDLEHFFHRDKFDMDVWFPAYSEPLSWGYVCRLSDPRFVQPNRDLLERTSAMRRVIGEGMPVQEAAFALGESYESQLRRGAAAESVFAQVAEVLAELRRSLPGEVFEEPVEIQGERVLPREIDGWSMRWAESVMSDPWPEFLSRGDAGMERAVADSARQGAAGSPA